MQSNSNPAITVALTEEERKDLERLPLSVQTAIRQVYTRMDEGKEEEAKELLRAAITRESQNRELRQLLAQLLFMDREFDEAEAVVRELLAEQEGQAGSSGQAGESGLSGPDGQPDKEGREEKLLLGEILHAKGQYEEAVQVLSDVWFGKSEEFPPFYNNTLGDCLQKLGKKQEAVCVFRREAQQYVRKGSTISDRMTDGTFQNLLVLDAELSQADTAEDIEAFKKFLKNTEMDETKALQLAQTIVLLSAHLNKKWFRPHFRSLVTFVEENGFLADSEQTAVLPSARSVLESLEYKEDAGVPAILETFLEAIPWEWEEKQTEVTEEEFYRIQTELTYSWYMCRYAVEHPGRIEYLKEKYPVSYQRMEPFLRDLEERGASVVQEELVEKLRPYMDDKSPEELQLHLEGTYQIAAEERKAPVQRSVQGETYQRAGRKIMPNDPCPCGSGKKYKKCCGRNRKD